MSHSPLDPRRLALLLPALLLTSGGALACSRQDRTPPPAKKVPVTEPAKGEKEKGEAEKGEPAKQGEPGAQGEKGEKGGAGDPVAEKREPGRVPGQNPAGENAYGAEKDPDAKLAIEYGKEKHDFGSARQGDQLEHVFELESAGTNPVKIRQASPTCGCTVSEIQVAQDDGSFGEYKLGDPIAPGRKVRIGAKIDTAHKQNKTNVRINVYSNDPIGLTQLSLSADIEPFLQATPSFLNFGDLKEGETKTMTVEVRTSRGEPIGLVLDAANPIPIPKGMTVDLQPLNPGQDGRAAHWRATVTIGEGAEEGNVGYQIRLLSDVEMPDKHDGKAPAEGAPQLHEKTTFQQVNASVSGRILGPLSFTPQFLSMGLVRPGQPVTRNVKLISHDPEFDLGQVKVELRGENGQELAWKDHFGTSVQPAPGMNNALDITLKLDGLPEGSDGSFRGELVIHTGHPRRPELLVRFSGVCRAGVSGGK